MRRTLGITAGLVCLAVGSSHAAEDVMIVYDGSNSMWGQIDGVAKIEIARDAMESLLGEWAEDTNVGLMAYGHRREGDCGDIETIIAPGPFDRETFMDRVRGITPRGKTPLTAAVEEAAQSLAYRDNPATVILITDGIETCQRDPCALAEELERSGVAFTAHVVGFDLGSEDHEAVACLAEHTGGRYIAADNAAELSQALGEVSAAVARTPEPAPEPEPEPDPTSAVEVTGPDTAVVGSTFKVSWHASEQAERDYVTIVPMGAAEGESGNYIRVGADSEGTLQAPGDAGLYEVRYVINDGRATAGSAEIEIVEAEVSVSAPERATTGSTFQVTWSRPVHPRDYVTIVPMGADEGESGAYTRVGDNNEGSLTAPATAGLYEVRYVLNEGRKTLASADIEVVEADIELSGPDTVRAESQFRVSWSGTAPHPRDYVTIVPMGAEEGDSGRYARVGDRKEADLSAPEETGLYEIRYVLNEGRRTLARHTVEVVAATAPLDEGGSLNVPEAGSPGETIEITWSADDNGNDHRIALAGSDQADFTWIEVQSADEGALTFTLPDAPGYYEFRLLDITERKVLSRAMIEVQ